MILAAMFWCGQFVLAAGEHGGSEHGGSEHGEEAKGSTTTEHSGAEHGGKEHGGEAKGSTTTYKQPSTDDIRKTMKDYVIAKSAESGTFDVNDEETNKIRRLVLVKVHERVGKTGDYYYSCADFKDVDSGELLDLDLDVEDNHGVLSVVDVRIHKLEGKKRYTYDENDNRIPLTEE